MFKLLILVIFCLLPYVPLSGCGDVYEQNVGFSTHRWAEQKSNLQYYNQTLHYRYRGLQIISHLCLFFSNCLGKKMFPTCSLEGSIAWPRWIKKKAWRRKPASLYLPITSSLHGSILSFLPFCASGCFYYRNALRLCESLPSTLWSCQFKKDPQCDVESVQTAPL